MTATEKLKGLTHAWYGYSFATTALGVLSGGLGLFSMVWGALSLAASFVIIWFIGNRLLAKSSLTRFLVLLFSGIAMASVSVGVARAGWMFLHDWSFKLLLSIFWGSTAFYMNLRSFRTLTDSSVKSYFG